MLKTILAWQRINLAIGVAIFGIAVVAAIVLSS